MREHETQALKVARLMADGAERTIVEIAEAVGCTQTAASARLRELRHVGCAVVCKPWAGRWRYRWTDPPWVREVRVEAFERDGLPKIRARVAS